MELIINKFKVPIYESGDELIPYFQEDVDHSTKLMSDYYEISVYNVDPYKLGYLKSKYIWLNEEIINY